MIMSNGKNEEDKEQINKLTIKKDGVQPDPSQKMHLPKKERYQDTSQLRRHTAYWVMVVVSEWLDAESYNWTKPYSSHCWERPLSIF